MRRRWRIGCCGRDPCGARPRRCGSDDPRTPPSFSSWKAGESLEKDSFLRLSRSSKSKAKAWTRFDPVGWVALKSQEAKVSRLHGLPRLVSMSVFTDQFRQTERMQSICGTVGAVFLAGWRSSMPLARWPWTRRTLPFPLTRTADSDSSRGSNSPSQPLTPRRSSTAGSPATPRTSPAASRPPARRLSLLPEESSELRWRASTAGFQAFGLSLTFAVADPGRCQQPAPDETFLEHLKVWYRTPAPALAPRSHAPTWPKQGRCQSCNS